MLSEEGLREFLSIEFESQSQNVEIRYLPLARLLTFPRIPSHIYLGRLGVVVNYPDLSVESVADGLYYMEELFVNYILKVLLLISLPPIYVKFLIRGKFVNLSLAYQLWFLKYHKRNLAYRRYWYL